jgi:hypothetical protein
MTIYALNDPEEGPFAFIVTLYRNESEIWAIQPLKHISSHGYMGVLGAYKFGAHSPETVLLRRLLRRAEVSVENYHNVTGPYIFKTDTSDGRTIAREFMLMRPEARDKLIRESKL